MKKFLLLSFMLMFAFAFSESWAQERTVSGKVTSIEDGSTLPGVNVVLKGTTTGTVTDIDGNFKLSVPSDGGTLVFSFIGLATEEIEIGARSVIDLQMSPDVQQLSEVVVSALMPDRNAREVVYANQTVGAEELLSTPNKNTLEALRGKAAGVKLSTGSGSVGASTRIVLRGEGSLTGNNNALIVVDGIAIDNESTSGGTGQVSTNAGTSTTGYADYGNRFNDINPDDIASVTILKGPSATSLYGSRGASGVVLITTKSGAKGKAMKIDVNSSFSVEKAYILMKRQNGFGQGYDNAHLDSGENWSWGPAVDGVVRPWTSPIDPDEDGVYEWLSRPYSAVDDQLQDFFNIGHTLSNSIGISGAKNDFTYYISYSNVDQVGILDNTEYKRNTFSFNASAKLSDKLTSNFKIAYSDVDQNTAQEGSRAFEGNNAYAMVLQSPITIPFNDLRNYNSKYHDINGYWGSYSSVNPYYILNEFGNEANIGNLRGTVSLTYQIMDGLDITGRFGGNVINTGVEQWTPKFSPETQLVWGDNGAITTRTGRHESPGDYRYQNINNVNLDSYIAANYTKDFSEDISFNATVGYNSFQRTVRQVTGETFGGLLVAGVYNLANSAQQPNSFQYQSDYRINGALANVRFGYKKAIFLEGSVRNDWSSTLPENSNSFLYQSIGASAVITDLVDMNDEVLSFIKLRTSYGSSGKDAGLYLLSSDFIGNPQVVELGNFDIQFPINGQSGSTVSNTIGAPELKPELTTTFEIGADIGLFDDRVNIAYTYYNSQHSDQIVNINLPRSSGFTQTASNIGEMENVGHEATLSLKPLYGVVDGLDFEIFGTIAQNKNKVKKIADGIDELVIGGPFTPGVSLVAKEGLPFGTFKALAPLMNDDQQTVVDPNTGMPLYTDSEVYLGSYQPKFMASIGANAKYKGFGFNILFDIKEGGKFVSQTQFFTEFNGTAEHTAIHNREPYVYPNSVIQNNDGSFTANTIEITEQDYFTNYDPAPSNYLINASYVKLREIGLSYTLPKQLLSNTPIQNARINLFAKNVKFWLPEGNIFADPEINGPALNGNASGIETSQTPPSRSYGVNLQITF